MAEDGNANAILKWSLLGVMVVVTIIFGLLPMKVLSVLVSSSSSSSSTTLGRRSTLVISLLSCFAGGIFLAVCLLDMLPDALKHFEEWKTTSGAASPDFPLVFLATCLGFFTVYILEAVAHSACDVGHGHSHQNDCADLNSDTLSIDSQVLKKFGDGVSKLQQMNRAASERERVISSLTFVAAFLLHVSLEGFALGSEEGTGGVVSLFIGVIVHKAIVLFSVGMRLARAHSSSRGRLFVCFLVLLLAIAPAICGGIAISLQSSNLESAAKSMVSCVLCCFSAGVFIHITFFEILGVEEGSLLQRMTTFVGFALIALLIYFTN